MGAIAVPNKGLARLDKFTSIHPIFRGPNFTLSETQKKGECKNQSQSARLIQKQLETIAFVPAFIFIVIPHLNFLQCGFYSVNFV